MRFHVQIWVVVEPERVLDILKHVYDFGAAIAWASLSSLRGREVVDVGLVLPSCELDDKQAHTYRRFMWHLFEISASRDRLGITSYDTPIQPYCPGYGGLVELDRCWSVPDRFSSVHGVLNEDG